MAAGCAITLALIDVEVAGRGAVEVPRADAGLDVCGVARAQLVVAGEAESVARQTPDVHAGFVAML